MIILSDALLIWNSSGMTEPEREQVRVQIKRLEVLQQKKAHASLAEAVASTSLAGDSTASLDWSDPLP